MDFYIDDDETTEIVNIALTSYDEHDLETYDVIFEKYIGSKLVRLIEIQNKYQSIGTRKVINDELNEYFEELFIACCPAILKGKLEMQQLYQLHLTSKLLTRFNNRVLGLSSAEFDETIYYPNLLNICAKHLISARRFIHRIIKQSFKDFKSRSNNLIAFYSELYNIDEQYIVNDINYFFLGNVLAKFDPIILPDINSIYFNTIQRMFYFYLKSKVLRKDYGKLDSIQMYDYEHVSTSSERYCLYEEALYLAQLYRVCETSNVITQIDSQVKKFKKAILPNEFQKLLVFNIERDLYGEKTSNIELIKAFYNESYDMTWVKSQTPIIYRLLRSMHIKNAKNSFSDADISYITPHIQVTLTTAYQHRLNEINIKAMVPKLTDNLVKTLFIGEYIDMMTMTIVNIPIVKFTEQLKLFLLTILDIGKADG